MRIPMVMRSLPRSAIVTGAAGGIGSALALALAAQGVNLLATDLDGDTLAAVAASSAELPGRIVALPSDLLDPAAPARLVAAATERHGPVDLLVNCAGFLKDARIGKMPLELFQRLIEINLLGPIRLSAAVLPGMVQARRGRIVSFSSRAWLGNFGSCGYSSAKGGIVGYSRALALAVAPHGVTVNCVAPGFIDTPMAASLPDGIKARVLSAIPVGRAGTVDDVVAMVLFLVSEESGYITGQTFISCGGRSISDPIVSK